MDWHDGKTPDAGDINGNEECADIFRKLALGALSAQPALKVNPMIQHERHTCNSDNDLSSD